MSRYVLQCRSRRTRRRGRSRAEVTEPGQALAAAGGVVDDVGPGGGDDVGRWCWWCCCCCHQGCRRSRSNNKQLMGVWMRLGLSGLGPPRAMGINRMSLAGFSSCRVWGLAALGRWSLKVTGAFPRAFLETFVAELCPPPPLPPLSLAWSGSSGALGPSVCHVGLSSLVWLSGPSVPFPLSFAQAAATPTPTTVSPKKRWDEKLAPRLDPSCRSRFVHGADGVICSRVGPPGHWRLGLQFWVLSPGS